MLNLLSGSFFDNEQDDGPVIWRDEDRYSGECLTDGEWESHSLITRGADWDHAHCQRACFLRFSLLQRPTCVGLNQCFKHLGTKRQKGRRLALNGTYVLETHIGADTANTTTNHVGERARTREFSRQDHAHEHVQHHRLRKYKGARVVSGKRERSGHFCSKIQTWLLMFLCFRIGTDVDIH